MTTAATLFKRIEALERGPREQEFKAFFIEEDPEKELEEDPYETARAWEQAHPWGRAHVIVFELVGGREPTTEPD